MNQTTHTTPALSGYYISADQNENNAKLEALLAAGMRPRIEPPVRYTAREVCEGVLIGFSIAAAVEIMYYLYISFIS